MDHLRPNFLDEPLAGRVPSQGVIRDGLFAAHGRAVELGLSMYRDPSTGYSVMTAAYLADRGYCCSSGCRHCPYAG